MGDVVPESEELAAERREEAQFMAAMTTTDAPPTKFYTDPVGVLSVDPLHLDEIDPASSTSRSW